ncbi:tetratricopeptide repeat protein [Lentzea sp. NPDC004782]|uniref:KGGVGR-motif variant AAA ATPase n=1 Tax=Lentzea sp. NPDC004782 TaxID=3154458 RepID=UPI0033B2F55F
MIVTFYSYKGGVGRSFCLANVAVQLARWGNRVLCVDFDLDAPGLHEYFRPHLSSPPDGGLVEVITGQADWVDVVEPLSVPDAEDLSLLAAGAMDASYPDRAQALSWPELFADHDLGWRFERIREEWKDTFDYVLIDSRTGITDIGGICTAQLPDVLVLCVAPNRQNLAGTLDVAGRAALARDKLPYDRDGLLYLPVVSRFDSKEEYERARSWRTTMAEEFAPLYASWLPKDQHDDHPELGLVERTTVPYLPYWSFGEEIAVLDERSGNPDSVSYYMDNIAALLAHRLADADVLVSNRDTYVAAARERGRRDSGQGFAYDVLVYGTSERAVEMHDQLVSLGVRAVRGRLADLSTVRHFVIVDPPPGSLPSLQEILDQVKVDPGRLVMFVGTAPDQVSSAVDVVIAVHEQDMGAHWEGVLLSAARLLVSRGDLAAAHALASRALKVARAPIQASLLLGELGRQLGDAEQAAHDLNRVLGVAMPDSVEAQRAHRLLGEIHLDQDQLPDAVRHFEFAVLGGDGHERALAYRELARVELRSGESDGALRHLALARAYSAGDTVLEAQIAFELGSLLVDRGDFEAAGERLLEAVERSVLPLDDQVTALRQLAYLETIVGRPHGAEEYLKRARDLPLSPMDRADIIIDLTRMRRAAFGLYPAIDGLLSEPLEPDDFVGRARLSEKLGALWLEAEEEVRAQEAFGVALANFRRLGDRTGEVRTLLALVTAEPALSEVHRAEARRLLTKLRGPEADLLWRQLDEAEPK